MMLRCFTVGLLCVGCSAFDTKAVVDAAQAPGAKLERDAGALGDGLGAALALEQTLMAVGAPGRDLPTTDASGDEVETPDAGAVILYDLASGTPSELAEINRGDDARWGDQFGAAIALNATTLVVGAPGADIINPDDDTIATSDVGAVFVYTVSGSTASLVGELRAPDARSGDRFGSALSLQADRLVVGAEGSDGRPGAIRDVGAVYIFTRSGTQFELANP